MGRLQIDAHHCERGYVAFRRSIQAGLSQDKRLGKEYAGYAALCHDAVIPRSVCHDCPCICTGRRYGDNRILERGAYAATLGADHGILQRVHALSQLRWQFEKIGRADYGDTLVTAHWQQVAAVACDDVRCAANYGAFYNLVVVRISDNYLEVVSDRYQARALPRFINGDTGTLCRVGKLALQFSLEFLKNFLTRNGLH